MSAILLPLFIASILCWLAFILFFRRYVPPGPLLRAPLALARRGGLIGWFGALSLAALILCSIVFIVMQLAVILGK